LHLRTFLLFFFVCFHFLLVFFLSFVGGAGGWESGWSFLGFAHFQWWVLESATWCLGDHGIVFGRFSLFFSLWERLMIVSFGFLFLRRNFTWWVFLLDLGLCAHGFRQLQCKCGGRWQYSQPWALGHGR
jgi:hypothetical protein